MNKRFKFLVFFSFFVVFPISCILSFHLLIPVLWIKTDQAFHCGNYERVVDYLSYISYMQPKNSEVYILKAWIQWSDALFLYKKGLPYKEKLEQAIETYEKGKKYNPTNWQIYFEEGMMWEAFGEKEKALQLYKISSYYAKPPYNRIYELKKLKK